MPVLLHRIRNATQLISGLNGMLAYEEAGAILEERAGDLASASQSAEETGWLLGLLASSLDTDLLMARCHARGLESFLHLVRDALRREGREIAWPADPLPSLAPRVGEGWHLAWAVGALLWWTARALPDGCALRWSLEPAAEGWQLSAEGPVDDGTRSLAEDLRQSLPDADFAAGEGGWSLRIPGPWLTR